MPAETPMPATIFGVAQEAGVSITTVSHVFSGKRHVSRETKERVLEVADRLGYRPRASARALATGRSMTIALQYSMPGAALLMNPLLAEILPAMSEIALRSGYSFIFVPPDPPSEVFVTPLLSERRIDAAILLFPLASDRFVRAVLDAGLPVITLGRIPGRQDAWVVDHDHDGACAQALAHLEERGYNRPALVLVESASRFSSDMRDAFNRLAPAGSEVAVSAELSEADSYNLGLELLDRPDRPDSIFCLNDLLAAGVKRAADELGIGVPDELGIISVGDSDLAAFGPVPLTSLRPRIDRAGRKLVELVNEVLDRHNRAQLDQDGPAELIPMQLIERASTARS